MTRFVTVNRDTASLLPPLMDEWLSEDYLARFVVDIVDQVGLSDLTRQYRGSSPDTYHPSAMLGLFICGYATRVYSSRRIEAATYDSIVFRFIGANEQRDNDSLCTFRKCFLNELEALFVQVLCIAQQMKLLKLGTIALDGTKLHARASRHSALSYADAHKIEVQLQGEVKQLLARAEAAVQEPLLEGSSIPEELSRREQRLAAIGQAKEQIDACAAERDAQEKSEFDAKMKARADKAAHTGNKPGGKSPAAPRAAVRPTDQINLTDADSRIVAAKGDAFEHSYNAQDAVDTESMLIVATTMAQAATDKHQVEPMLEVIAGLAAQRGTFVDR